MGLVRFWSIAGQCLQRLRIFRLSEAPRLVAHEYLTSTDQSTTPTQMNMIKKLSGREADPNKKLKNSRNQKLVQSIDLAAGQLFDASQIVLGEVR